MVAYFILESEKDLCVFNGLALECYFKNDGESFFEIHDFVGGDKWTTDFKKVSGSLGYVRFTEVTKTGVYGTKPYTTEFKNFEMSLYGIKTTKEFLDSRCK